MARRLILALKFVGTPSCEVELVDNIMKPNDDENWAHNKLIICCNARYSLPPQDHPNSVANIQRTISASLDSLINESPEIGRHSTFFLVDRMLELVLFPLFRDIVDQIIAGVNAIADKHRAEVSAATTPVALRMNVNISSLLHEIPRMYFAYQESESANHVADIADLPRYESRREQIIVEQVIPYYNHNLSYDERERIFQRNNQVVNSESDDDDDDFDPSSLPIMFLPASEDSIESLEKVTVDLGSISISKENCSICLEDISVGTEATRLPCSHHYHPDCVVKWLEISKFCPLCRFELS